MRLLSKRLITHLHGKLGNYLFAILFLPGTIVHELSHFVMATLLIVRSGKLEFIPEEQGDGVKLGSVSIEKTDPIRKLLIGSAPFIFGTSIILGFLFYTSYNNLLGDWRVVAFLVFLIFEIGNTMFLSQSDIEGSWKVFIILITFMALGVVFKIDLSFISAELIFTEDNVRILQTANLYLLAPIVIDSVLLLFLSTSDGKEEINS